MDGVINFVKGIFGKKEEESEDEPAITKNLKPTVSIAVLEEKVILISYFSVFYYICAERLLYERRIL